jgi:asparagine synthase (glutamine-hydrolysing)
MQNDFDIEEACSDLRALLDKAIRGEKAGGVLLSGGLDTSIVALIAKRHAPGLKAFTITLEGFDGDLKYAKRVAQFLELDHRVHFFSQKELMDAALEAESILNNSEYEACVPSHIKEGIVEGYSEVVGPTTFAPAYIAMRFAKKYVDSIYTGDGADELFIGYDSIISFIDLIASSGDESFASDLEQDLSSRVFQAYDLRYPYMLACALGLEVKAPYLSVEVSEFARKIPVDYKVRSEKGRVWGKWLLRKAFEDYLPSEIVWRKKTTIDSGTGAIRVLNWR